MSAIPDWHEQAACRRFEPELWFATDGWQAQEAVTVCRNWCPVRDQCLTAGIENNEAGTWGGYIEKELRSLRRRHLTTQEPEGPLRYCTKGHSMTADNVYLNRNAKRCRTCAIDNTQKWKQQQRSAAA